MSGLSGYAALQTFNSPPSLPLAVTDRLHSQLGTGSKSILFIYLYFHAFHTMLTIKVALVEQVESLLKLVFSWAMHVHWFLSHMYGTDLIFLRPS